jgi:hypothetical protein
MFFFVTPSWIGGWQEAKKGQGLCLWTPLGFETPDPQILRN